jgi:hypothetical protein
VVGLLVFISPARDRAIFVKIGPIISKNILEAVITVSKVVPI